MSKKKILILTDSLTGGGMEKVLVNLVNNLDHNKYDIEINTIYKDETRVKELNTNIKYRCLYRPITILGKSIRIPMYIHNYRLNNYSSTKLYKHFIRGKYDIEIAFFRGPSIKIISGSDNKNSLKLAWVHSDFKVCKGITRNFKSMDECIQSYKKFNKIVCVSDHSKNSFIDKMKISNNVITKYNVNDCEKILELAKEQVEINQDNKYFNICTVGRLVKAKGYDRLIEVCKRLNKDGYKYNLCIVGDGGQKEELQSLIDEYKLNNIKLLGFTENPYKYISNSDLFVCSSRWEGFSTVVSEAVILGIPVVSTDCSGAREILGDSEYGLVTENSTDGIYKGLKIVLEDKEIYNHYKNKVKDRSKFFDTSKLVKDIENLFNEL